METYIGNICQNTTIDYENVKWIDCEFTNCRHKNKKPITQEFIDKHENFENCIETNELHTNSDKLPEYILKRLNQRDKSKFGTDLT